MTIKAGGGRENVEPPVLTFDLRDCRTLQVFGIWLFATAFLSVFYSRDLLAWNAAFSAAMVGHVSFFSISYRSLEGITGRLLTLWLLASAVAAPFLTLPTWILNQSLIAVALTVLGISLQAKLNPVNFQQALERVDVRKIFFEIKR